MFGPGTEVANSVFSQSRVDIDGVRFTSCVFDHCLMVYSGGDLPRMSHCRFNGCNWVFEGAAARTMAYLSALYADGATGIVEDLFNAIRVPRTAVGSSEPKLLGGSSESSTTPSEANDGVKS